MPTPKKAPLPRIASAAKSNLRYFDHNTGKYRIRQNSGDFHFDAVRHQKNAPTHPCQIRISDWPVCHMRCYHRHRCGAALASDLQFNIWGI